VGLDTAPLIYFIEKHPVYFPMLLPFFEAVERGDIEIVTSTLTLTEVLVHPLRHGNQELAQQYSRILLNALHVQTFAVSPGVAIAAAHLRASHGYKTPQAGHATFFVTNDDILASTSSLQVVVLKNLLTQP
jgi:predicted nucleic acid-binding protein